MQRPKRFYLLTLGSVICSVCSAQVNQSPMNDNKMLMHNAMIQGDTKTMGMMLDSGAIKIDDWVGIGNIQTWAEDACWCGSPVGMEYLLQRGADTLRADRANKTWPNMKPENALAWCVGAGTRPPGPSTAEVFKVFIKDFEQRVNKTADPRKTLNEQIAMAGGTGHLVGLALENTNDDACLEKVTWVVESGQDISEFEHQSNWQTLLSGRSKSNPTCVTYLRSELEKRAKSPGSK